MHQLPPTLQRRADTNDRLSAVLQVDSLSTENQDGTFIGRDDPPSYNEVFRDGLNHAGEEPPPEYQSPGTLKYLNSLKYLFVIYFDLKLQCLTKTIKETLSCIKACE